MLQNQSSVKLAPLRTMPTNQARIIPASQLIPLEIPILNKGMEIRAIVRAIGVGAIKSGTDIE